MRPFHSIAHSIDFGRSIQYKYWNSYRDRTMMVTSTLISVASALALCILLHSSIGVDSKQVQEEKIKAIKDHIEQIEHILEKRAADDKKSSSDTTTIKPASTTSTTTTRRARKSNAKYGSTTTKKPGKNHQDTSTKSPKDLVEDAEKELRRERDYWVKQEELALSYAIAGLDAWIRAYRKLGRSHAQLKAGELLYLFDNTLRKNVSSDTIRNLIRAYLNRSHKLLLARPPSKFHPRDKDAVSGGDNDDDNDDDAPAAGAFK